MLRWLRSMIVHAVFALRTAGRSSRQRELPPRAATHILVVDDDPLLREMLVRFLETEGLRVSEAADGAAMRECLDRLPIDLILLDLDLPGEDGLTLLRELRSWSEVPIIILTSRDDVSDRVVGLEAGADDYIGKPFHPPEVLARIRVVLRRPTRASHGIAGGRSKGRGSG